MSITKSAEDIFIKSAKIIDPNSSFHNKKADVLIKNGRIVEIGKDIKDPFGAARIDEKNMCVSPGWFDMQVNVQDPGFEYKEDITSALDAAGVGGFTGILSNSTTDPCVDTKSGVEYQLKKAQGHVVDLNVSGTISKAKKGEELSEMFDMHQAGAVAFADYKNTLDNTLLLKVALQYASSFNGLLILHAQDKYLSTGGIVNESAQSTRNGLRGIPSISEEMAIYKVIKLVQYTGHRIHLSCVSTKEGVALISKARKDGLPITCSISSANLALNESEADSFDSNFKLFPPLREERSRKQLVNALLKGDIDIVVSDHSPENVENKECEFEQAAYGMTNLETSAALTWSALKESSHLESFIKLMSHNPRQILNLSVPRIEEGENANITIFQEKDWTFDKTQSLSKSRNTSLSNRTFPLKVLGIVNRNTYHFI